MVIGSENGINKTGSNSRQGGLHSFYTNTFKEGMNSLLPTQL